MEDDSPLEGQQDLLVQDEYEQDSSDEEVGILEFSWNFGILSRIGDGSDEFGKNNGRGKSLERLGGMILEKRGIGGIQRDSRAGIPIPTGINPWDCDTQSCSGGIFGNIPLEFCAGIPIPVAVGWGHG